MAIHSQHSQRGVSITSLLIGVLISSILLTGLVTVFSGNYKTSLIISDLGIIHEGLRVGQETITESMRQSGHFGGLHKDNITTHTSLTITGVGGCNKAWITNTDNAFYGMEGASSPSSISGLPSGCIDSDLYEPDTDIFVARYASTIDMAPTASLSANTVYIKTSIGNSQEDKGEIFQGTHGSTINTLADDFGIYNYKYAFELYYVRKCTEISNGKCLDDIPALIRLTLNDTELQEELVIEGAEQFQIEYGIDNDGDYIADSFTKANSVLNWNSVVSSRFSLVIRGDRKDSMPDKNTYTLAGDYSFSPATDDKYYKRRAYTKLVQLRNMTRI